MLGQMIPTARELSPDEQLARRIRNFVVSHHSGQREMRLEVDRGVVKLTGSVHSFYQKQLWVHGAKRVAGVVQILDEIEVQ